MARKGGEQTVWVNGIRVDLVQPHQSDRVRLLRAVAGFTGPMPPTKGGSRPLPRKKHVPGQAQSPRIRGDRLRRALEKAAAESPNFSFELFEDDASAAHKPITAPSTRPTRRAGQASTSAPTPDQQPAAQRRQRHHGASRETPIGSGRSGRVGSRDGAANLRAPEHQAIRE